MAKFARSYRITTGTGDVSDITIIKCFHLGCLSRVSATKVETAP